MTQRDCSGAGIVFVAPTLAIDVAIMAQVLEADGRLTRLVTRSCLTESVRACAAQIGFRTAWVRRPSAPVGLPRLRRVWSADLRERLGRRFNKNAVENLDAAFTAVDRAAAKLVTVRTQAVIAREDSCLASFEQAKRCGIPRIYVMPTAHHSTVQKLIRREAGEFPELFCNGEISADFAPGRTARKDAELAMATHIVCPSEFVGNSLRSAGISSQRLVKLVFGAGPAFKSLANIKREPLFLYVGRIGPRKGVHRLIRVWKQLGAHRTHRLRLVGDFALSASFTRAYRTVFEHVPPLPRESLPAEYARAQAFVFNALADGFGHVIGEAMACGTPILASRNCGAPDLIREGSEGRLVEYGDDQALGSVLDWALSHPNKLAEMGVCARDRARQRNWERFEREFLLWIAEVT